MSETPMARRSDRLTALRSELRTLLEYYLLPGLISLVPWRVGVRWARRLAGWQRLYAGECWPSLAQARALLGEFDDDDWCRRFRFGRLVDHADFWRSLLFPRWRLLGDVLRQGDWPSLPGGAVGVFFHWGANLPAVYSLHQSGQRSSVLAGRFSRRSMGGAVLGYWYGRMRIAQLARASGGPLIYAPGTVRQSLDALAAGRWVIGTPDVPPTETRFSIPLRLFGRDGHMPEGLLLIARQARVPVVIFTMALDFDSGRRELRIEGPFDPDDPNLMQRIADTWQALIREKPWAFTLWPAMPAYFAASNQQK